jgi:hypothetical protein
VLFAPFFEGQPGLFFNRGQPGLPFEGEAGRNAYEHLGAQPIKTKRVVIMKLHGEPFKHSLLDFSR